MATYSSILAWEIPWTEGPGGLQSAGSQKNGHNLASKQQQMYIYSNSLCTNAYFSHIWLTAFHLRFSLKKKNPLLFILLCLNLDSLLSTKDLLNIYDILRVFLGSEFQHCFYARSSNPSETLLYAWNKDLHYFFSSSDGYLNIHKCFLSKCIISWFILPPLPYKFRFGAPHPHWF